MKRIAILIGNNKFPDDKSLSDLFCPENDTIGFRNILEKHGNFTNIFTFINMKSDEIIIEIYNIFKSVSRNDLIVLYYSGHGLLGQTSKLHLATFNTKSIILEPTSIPIDRIKTYIDEFSLHRMIVILDCCFSGAAATSFTLKSDVNSQLNIISKGICLITASTHMEPARENKKDKYSILTKHIINGIENFKYDQENKGIITIDDLYSYVYNEVIKESNQVPTKHGFDLRGNLIIAQKSESEIAIHTTPKKISSKTNKSNKLKYIASTIILLGLLLLSNYAYKIYTNIPPEAQINVDTNKGYTPLLVNLSGISSIDPDGSITKYNWTINNKYMSTGVNLKYLFNEPGEYLVELEVIDDKGKKGTSNSLIAVLNKPPKLSLDFSSDEYSINEDLFLTPQISYKGEVKKYHIEIKVENSITPLKSWSYIELPKEIKFNLKDIDNSFLDNLNIVGYFYVEASNGNFYNTYSNKIRIIPAQSSISIKSNYLSFSPNNNGIKDSLIILQESKLPGQWKSYITDKSETIIKQWTGNGYLNNIEWKGDDYTGEKVLSGNYIYSINFYNETIGEIKEVIKNIKVDTDILDGSIDIKYNSPLENSDILFNINVDKKNDITNWKIDIIKKEKNDENITYTFSNKTSQNLMSSIIWKNDKFSKIITDGKYIARLKVEYESGNYIEVDSKSFIYDTTPPQIFIRTSPTPFSPDNDYVHDELTIELDIKDISEIQSWEFRIKDTKGNEFISFSGKGKPGKRIIWDGMSSYGELVQSEIDYIYTMTVKDIVGNIGTSTGLIQVDTLVIKDGNNLKIQIPAFNFKNETSDLVTTGTYGMHNTKILKRLSEILKKYSSYKIFITGHTNDNLVHGSNIKQITKDKGETIKHSLIELGIDENRIHTEGKGASQIIYKDENNLWKNDRIEFHLVKD